MLLLLLAPQSGCLLMPLLVSQRFSEPRASLQEHDWCLGEAGNEFLGFGFAVLQDTGWNFRMVPGFVGGSKSCTILLK